MKNKASKAQQQSTNNKNFFAQSRWQSNYFIIPYLMLFAGIVFIVAVIYLKYFWNKNNNNPLPLIKASIGTIKIKPNDPGGMIVANLDKTIYENINNEQKVVIERTLPSPEEPISKAAILDGSYLEDKSINKPTKVITANQGSLTKFINHHVTQTLLVSDDKILKPLPKDKLSKLDHSKKLQNTNNNYKVQLAAYKTAKEASIRFIKLQKQHPKLFNNYHHIITKKNLTNQGILYLLQIGNFNNESQARLFCKKLSNPDQGCFVIKPINYKT